MVAKEKPVTIVLLNYNKPDVTIRCLNSLKMQTYKNFSIILIENGSRDNSVEVLEKYLKHEKGNLKIDFHKEKNNLFFDGGVNVGVKKAKTEYIIILDNDIVAVPDWIQKLVTKLESDPDLAIAGSPYTNVGGLYVKRVEERYVINFLGELVPTEHPNKSFTFYADAGALIYKKSMLGLPYDPDFNFLFEDVYMSGRAWLAGYKVEMADTLVDHIGGLTRTGISELWEFSGERNRVYCLILLYSKKTLLKIAPLLVFQTLLTLISSTLKLRVHMRIKSYWWFIANRKKVFAHRKRIQQMRKLSDQVLFDHMTYKIRYNIPIIKQLGNAFMWLYCFIFRIKTFDLYGTPKIRKTEK